MSASYTLNIGGTVPPICWIKPAGEKYEVFCNAPSGFEVVAGERVVLSGNYPFHSTVSLDLAPGETTLTVRVK